MRKEYRITNSGLVAEEAMVMERMETIPSYKSGKELRRERRKKQGKQARREHQQMLAMALRMIK